MQTGCHVNDTLPLSVKYLKFRNTLKLVVIANSIRHCSYSRLQCLYLIVEIRCYLEVLGYCSRKGEGIRSDTICILYIVYRKSCNRIQSNILYRTDYLIIDDRNRNLLARLVL